MDRRLGRAIIPALFLLAISFSGALRAAYPASGGEVRVAALVGYGSTIVMTKPPASSHMTPRPQMAQFRCPGGQLVFLTRACGCNGACCACSGNARYLNHCTCQCETAPSTCAKGHSVGNP